MLENDRLKPYFLQIDLENMIMAVKNIRIVSLVGITSEFRTGPRFMPARPWSSTWHVVDMLSGEGNGHDFKVANYSQLNSWEALYIV